MSFITLPLQLLALIFLIFAFSRVWLRTREGSIGWGMFFFWTLIWVLAILAIVRPELTTQVANRLGIGRGADAVLYISIVLLFYLNFRTNVMLENLRHDITKLTRTIALSKK